MRQHTVDVWGDKRDRTNQLIPLPVGKDGVMRSVPFVVNKVEARFLAALMSQATPEAFEAALDYAVSDRA